MVKPMMTYVTIHDMRRPFFFVFFRFSCRKKGGPDPLDTPLYNIYSLCVRACEITNARRRQRSV